jgi:hypothetical protein
MMYHLGLTRKELDEMTNEEWAEQYAILADIRRKESEPKSPSV